MRLSKRGFTLVELMITVAIIAILATIAIAQYKVFLVKSQEATTFGNLGTLRSAISVYYSDLEGSYPSDTADLVSLTAGGKYIQSIPYILLPLTPNSPGHPLSTSVQTTAIDDSGGLFYYNGGINQSQWGKVVVNCLHQDMRGSVWSAE